MALLNNNAFLLDRDFLRLLDLEKEKEIFAKVISLDFQENPMEEIEGRVTQGSVTVDGSSSVRRTCSLTLAAHELNIHNFYWGLNTKFQLFIGVKNTIKKRTPYLELYHNYPDICWFKMGTYIISSFSTSQTTNQYSISLQGKDKMTLLNGEIGGTITPLSWDFGTIQDIEEDGTISITDYLIKDIILEAVHEHAQEPYWNIIINDLDDYGLELLEYRGDIPLYLLYNVEQEVVDQMLFDISSLNINEATFIYDSRVEPLGTNNATEININGTVYTIIKAEYGDTIGYRTTDLTYAGDLISNVGETVTSMLDKLIAMLGEFEYFYDLEGRFIFQRKKTYIESTFSPITNEDSNSNNIYVKNAAETSSVIYSFDNSMLVTSFSNSPDFANIKNDFSIWGSRKSINGTEIPIHLRYAIDTKPWYYKNYDGVVYITQEGLEEYERLRVANILYEIVEDASIEYTTGNSIFHMTPLPAGLSSDWWEIDDWARRYLYYADVDNTHNIQYYLKLSSEELVNIVTSATRPTDENIHDFNYFVYQLKTSQLGVFNSPWYTTNWLSIFPQPEGINNGYYNAIKSANNNNLAFWVWLFDTALTSDGQEYIKSIEHGYRTTDSINNYPNATTGCSHVFSYALSRKQTGSTNYYHSYIYNPEIPDTIKSDDAFSGKINSDLIDSSTYSLGLENWDYIVVDWREIIYQMSVDYNLYHHDEDFLLQIDANNALFNNSEHLYPGGYTKYEQYYIDLNGFWRDLYDPNYRYSFNIAAPNKTKYAAHINDYYVFQNCKNLTYADLQNAITAWSSACGKPNVYYRDLYGAFSELTAIPTLENYNQHPEFYYFVRGCRAINNGNQSYTKQLPYNSKEIYFTKVTGEYDTTTHWSIDVIESPETINFWFDFLDTEGEIGKYKVCKIGDRTKAANDTNINSIYYREVPTVIFVDTNTNIQAEKAKKGTGYTYIKLPEYLENLFSMSAQGKSAMDVLNEWLYSYAYCAESITLNALPVFYLEPNTRILVRDDNSGINGEYIVTRLTFPLSHNGTMSISATKAVERLY